MVTLPASLWMPTPTGPRVLQASRARPLHLRQARPRPAMKGSVMRRSGPALAFIKSRWPKDVIESQTQFSRSRRMWITRHNAD